MINLSNDDVYEDLLERREIEIYNLSDLNSELRFEAEHFQKKYYHLFDLLSKKKCEKLGSLVSDEIKTGHTPSMKNQSFYGGNYNFIKTDNLRTNEITEPFSNQLSLKGYETLKRVHLKPGDIIVTIIGATYDIIARCALISDEILPATINQNIALVRPGKNKIVPEYLVSYMNSKYGRMCLEYLARQTEQVNLNCQEIAQDIVPIFSGDFQAEIKSIVSKAYTLLRRSKASYKQAESDLIGALSLDTWVPSQEQVSVRSYMDISKVDRIDAEYYQSKYDELIAKIKILGSGTVQTECNLYSKNFNPEKSTEYKYIELANIGNCGEINGCTLDLGSELPTRARRIVHTGNIIISSVEGSLQSCALIPDSFDGALCSTGFYVLDSNKINSETLLVLFKSAPIQALLKQQCTGTILTAFSKDGLLSIPIPKIDSDLQNKIRDSVKESFALRQKSTNLLEVAKHAVEIAIEQNERKAASWLRGTVSQAKD